MEFLTIEEESLRTIRQRVKEIFIQKNVLSSEDFYSDSEISYLPSKSTLGKKLVFSKIFEEKIIAKTITLAHHYDESFVGIIDSCKSQLGQQTNKFKCLLILAGGSGQLASHLIRNLSTQEASKISNRMYGVDLSAVMTNTAVDNTSEVRKGAETNNIKYHPVLGDCTSYDHLLEEVPDLRTQEPVLVLSHGGARYFVRSQGHCFLDSLKVYPAGTSITITEVGIENYDVLQFIYENINSSKNFRVKDFSDVDEPTMYKFCNLTYYYFLFYQYYVVADFRGLIDTYLQEENIAVKLGMGRDYRSLISLLMLKIAGTRQQPLHTLDIEIV